MKIYKNTLELIGDTPMMEIENIDTAAKIYTKLEFFNPGGSVKDRIALSMIEAAEKDKLLNNESVIIEATSGNTGIGLAIVASLRGYELILTMPDTMSLERRKLLCALGAKLVLTPGSLGMAGAIGKAHELAASHKNSFMPQQFSNKANPEAHKKTTAVEIWNFLKGNVDIFVSGVGTGGTITGVGEFLKAKNKKSKVIAVEPYASSVLSGGSPGIHGIQGIGAGFVPELLNKTIIDEIFRVKDNEAYNAARWLAARKGILAGISSGANLHAALEIARRTENAGKNIVTVLPDCGERYLSTELFK